MPRHPRSRAFTLTELLVVILIISILIAILIPTISSVRKSAMKTDTANLISQISSAITRYYQDFNAYPGVFSNSEILNETYRVASDGDTIDGTGDPITMTENLVLSLLGGIKIVGSNHVFDKSLTLSAAGATSLSDAAPKRYSAYMSVREGVLSAGKMADSGIPDMSDSSIPEFVDTWPQADQMPILYMRARQGASGIVSNGGNPLQYDLRFLAPYRRGIDGPTGDGTADVGQTADDNGTTYFRNPSLPNLPVAKDTFVLIAPGVDRIYGTSDDITSWGN